MHLRDQAAIHCKKARPECLVVVTILTTRVHDVDEVDMGKLKRANGYLIATSNLGLVLRVMTLMKRGGPDFER